MQTFPADDRHSMLYVCMLGTPVCYTKMGEPIMHQFEGQTCVNPKNQVLYWGLDPLQNGAILWGFRLGSNLDEC